MHPALPVLCGARASGGRLWPKACTWPLYPGPQLHSGLPEPLHVCLMMSAWFCLLPRDPGHCLRCTVGSPVWSPWARWERMSHCAPEILRGP